jgi:uncharacterized integral membrane protein (TIGR00697 family)
MKINKMDLLIAIYIFCIFASEVMGAKTFPLINIGWHQFNASVAIFLLPVIFSINDIIVEVFGKQRMREIIRVSMIIIVLIVITATFFTLLPSSVRFSGTEAAYDTIFATSIRMSIASLAAFTFADFLDVHIFSKLREMIGTSKLWLRTNLSNIIAQFVDTFIFMTLAFYAFDQSFSSNASFILSIGIPYWILKCLMSVIETPFVYLWVNWLKKDK